MVMLVHLKNLAPSARPEDVRKFFDQAKVVIPEGGVNIVKSKDGTAFINFGSSQDLLEAVKLDGKELLSQPVKLLLITYEEKEEILTEIRKQELMEASRSETGSSEKKVDRGKQGGGAQAGRGVTRGSSENCVVVSDLPRDIGRRNLMTFLGASPHVIARHAGIAMRPQGEGDKYVGFVKFINEESYLKSLKRDGDSYDGSKVMVNEISREEFEAEVKGSSGGSRKRAMDETDDDSGNKKTKTGDESESGEAYYVIVKNLHGDIRPTAMKELFGWIEYDKIVLRPDKKDRSLCVAFMKFSEKGAQEKALSAHREHIQGQQVFVKEYSEAGYESERRQHGTHADRLAMSELYLFITNIEGSVTERGLRGFFGRKIWDAIPEGGIIMRPDLKYPEKQVAYIQFRTKAAYEQILETDNRQLNGKWMVVKKSSEKQFLVQRRFLEEEQMGMNMDGPMGGGNRWNGNQGNMGGGGGYGGDNMQGSGYGGMSSGRSNMGPYNMGGANQGRCCILVNNLPNYADVKWVHQLFDDCPLNVSQTRLVSEGMLPLYAYVELQNDMDCARACSRDGRRIDNININVRQVLPEAVERDLSTLPPRMRVSKMEMDQWMQKGNQDPFLEQGRGGNYNNQNYGGYQDTGNYDDSEQSNTPNTVLNGIRELESACGGDVEVVELKALPKKLNHDAVYLWLKQQPGNLEVMGKNSDIINYQNTQMEVVLIAIKSFTTALPRWAFIDNVICELKHRSQKNACPGCRKLDHRNVTEECPAYADNSDVIYFEAADHLFSPFHMSVMPFNFKGKSFVNIFQAYLWEECHQLGLPDLRNAIMRVQDPRLSNLKEFIFGIPKLEALNWEMNSFNVLVSLYKSKWEVCPEFRQALTETGGKMLVYANSRCSHGVGIQSSSLVPKLNALYYQGENIIGKVIMSIRDEKNHLCRN